MRLSKRWFCMFAGMLFGTLTIFGCSATTSNSIQLTQETCSILEGETRKLVALTVEEGNVSWESSDDSVVSVIDGEIIGKKEGTAIITASMGNMKADCTVTVSKDNIPSSYLKSKEDGYFLEIGDETGIQTDFVLCSTDSEGNVTEKTPTDLTYKIYNRGIAKIDEQGVLKPLEVGPTTLTVTSGEYSCTVDVIVSTKLIHTPKEWLEMIATTNNLESYYYVMNDLDFDGVQYNGVGTSIEKEASKCFRGTIDGGNHVIKNITINCSSGYHGIFGALLDAKIKNISFENVSLTASGTIVNGCGIAPSISGHGSTMENVFVDLQYKKKASGNSNILAGEIAGNGTFENCLVTVSSPSGNITRDGIDVVEISSGDAQFKKFVVFSEGAKLDKIPNGVQVFADKMEAIWALNAEKMLGSEWNYSVTDFPVLGE